MILGTSLGNKIGSLLASLVIFSALVFSTELLEAYPPRKRPPKNSPSKSTNRSVEPSTVLGNPYSVSLWLACESPVLVPGVKFSSEKTMAENGSFYVQELLDWTYDYTSRDIGEEIEFLEGQLILKVNLLDVVDVSAGGIALGSLVSELTGAHLDEFKSAAANLSVGKSSTRVTIEIEIYDATNGRQLASTQQKAEAKGSAFSLALEGGTDTLTKSTATAVAFDNETYVESGFGKAMETALAKGMSDIIKKLKKRPWECLIVDVEDETVYLNVGEKSKLTAGTKLSVHRVTKTLTHPKSGRILQVLTEEVGELTVKEVLEEITVTTTSTEGPLEVSDIVRLKKGNESGNP
jgi:hypothetical protein